MSLRGSVRAPAVVMSFQVGFVSWAHIIAATVPRAGSLSRGLCLSPSVPLILLKLNSCSGEGVNASSSLPVFRSPSAHEQCTRKGCVCSAGATCDTALLHISAFLAPAS